MTFNAFDGTSRHECIRLNTTTIKDVIERTDTKRAVPLASPFNV